MKVEPMSYSIVFTPLISRSAPRRASEARGYRWMGAISSGPRHCEPPDTHTRKQSNSLVAVIHKQEIRHKVLKSVLRVVLGRMQFTIHATRRTPHGASRLVHAMSAWLVNIRRVPSRHSRDARVYGHTTTVMRKLSTPPPPPPSAPGVSRPESRKEACYNRVGVARKVYQSPDTCHGRGAPIFF